MAFFGKFFGDANAKSIKEAQILASEVNVLENQIESLSNTELREKTQDFKKRITAGDSLDSLLVEAFAVVREAARRTLEQRHFDVQLIGGIVLYQGKVAEMRTGEGKTLTSTLPVYLNALSGKGVHLITVNDYLTKRDAVWMGQIYDALGLSVGCIVHEGAYIYDPEYQVADPSSSQDDQYSERDKMRDTTGSFRVEESYLRPASRKEAYEADITYGTNNEFGFDYLRDNMVYDLKDQVQRGHFFAIIDEVDSVLIDEARTPLIISAPDQESSNWYGDFAKITPRLTRDVDYELDEKLKTVTITDAGIDKVEEILGVKDIYQEKGIKYVHHIEQALKAEVLFQKDRDYVVRDGQVMIIDEFTGRLLPGRRFSSGLHQALEAKEGVSVQPESITFASVTFQNYFRMYEKLAGMTGTALTSAEEFFKVYKLDVVEVPTNKPMIRKNLSDKIFKTEKSKFAAVVQEIVEKHKQGQPVLVGTVSIQKNEYLGKLLEREGIPHQVLNAKQHEREASIIAQAGSFGAVTVATNMAGRGVDIVLGGNPSTDKEAEKVKESGGLHVVGTERHEARRIDNQLRGRSGRQGDPGSSQFFISLEDDLARIFGGERIKGLMETLRMPEDQPIEAGLVSRSIESAQSKIEGFHFDARKHLLDYDDVLNKHRDVLYKRRREVLKMAQAGELKEYVADLAQEQNHTKAEYEQKEKELGVENMRQVERIVCLRVIDSLWVGHLEDMEYMRDSVRLRAYGQQDPLVEYKNEGHRMFQELLDNINATIANTIFRAQITGQQPTPFFQNKKAGQHTHTHSHSHAATNTGDQNSRIKVGRNDPCPCGSGKKWKRCGMIQAPEHKG